MHEDYITRELANNLLFKLQYASVMSSGGMDLPSSCFDG